MATTILDVAKANNISLTSIRPMIFMDECRDVFLLTEKAEIFWYGEGMIRCYIFPKSTFNKNLIKPLIINEMDTDDDFHICDVAAENLEQVLTATGWKRHARPPKNSKRIANLERLLNHKIIQWTPKVEIKQEAL